MCVCVCVCRKKGTKLDPIGSIGVFTSLHNTVNCVLPYSPRGSSFSLDLCDLGQVTFPSLSFTFIMETNLDQCQTSDRPWSGKVHNHNR